MRKEFPQPRNTFEAVVEIGIKSANVNYIEMLFNLRFPLSEISGNPNIPDEMVAGTPNGLRFQRSDFFSIKESSLLSGEKIFTYAARINIFDAITLRLSDLQYVEADDHSYIEFVSIRYDNGAVQFINRKTAPAIFDGRNIYDPGELDAYLKDPSKYVYFHEDRLVISDEPIDEEGYARKTLGNISDIMEAADDEDDGSVEIIEDNSTVSDFFEPVEVKTKDDKVIKYDFSKVNNGGYTS